MARSREAIHIGVGGHVVAIDAKSGEELWRTKLKGASTFVSVLVSGKHIIAGAQGELFCLDLNGSLVWHNKLKGLGLGFVTLSSNDAGAAAAIAAAAAAAAQAAAASAAATAAAT